MSKRSVPKTVLVVAGDVAVLILLRGILENEFRVLVAPDADNAVRLLTIDGLRIDLAIVTLDVLESQGNRLESRMTQILPELPILSVTGFVQGDVIRFKASVASKQRNSDDFVQQVRGVFDGNARGRKHSPAFAFRREVAVCNQAVAMCNPSRGAFEAEWRDGFFDTNKMGSDGRR